MRMAAVREEIHERLDPVIEEIVGREISQRVGYQRGMEQSAPTQAQALKLVLLATMMQQRPAGAEEGMRGVLPLLVLALIESRFGWCAGVGVLPTALLYQLAV